MRPSSCVRAGTLVALLLGAAPSPHGAPDDLAEYRRIVEAFRDRDDDALVRAGGLPADRLPALVSRAAVGLDRSNLRAAVVLHTDLAVRILRAEGHDADPAPQLDAAERLLDALLLEDGDAQAFARRWYLVAEGYLRAAHLAHSADALQDRARARLGPDPGWQRFLRGLQHELAAALAGPISPAALPARYTGLDATARRELVQAARDFEDALALDPGLSDAALHLGRVSLVLQQYARAVPPLEAAARSSDPGTVYLARLFLGAVAERQDRYADAEAHYRAAVDVFRWGQSGPLALAHLLGRTARHAEARETLAAHFERTAGRVADPLWTYLVDPGDHLGPALDDLRAEVWR